MEPGNPPDLRDPWDRRDDESDVAWEAFTLYRDDPSRPRSLQRVASELAKSRTLISRWSAQKDWVERCGLYDGWRDRKKREEEHVAVRRMARRHAQVAATAIDVAIRPSMALLERIKNDPQPFSDKSIDELYDLAIKSQKVIAPLVQVERLARGMSTEHVEITSDGTGSVQHPGRQWLGEVYAALEEAGISPEDLRDHQAASQNGDHPE